MSEEKNAQVEQEVSVVENETESVDQSAQDNNEVGSLIAESKKYRTRAQSAEAELKELKENQRLQEQKRLEEKESEVELAASEILVLKESQVEATALSKQLKEALDRWTS